MVSYLIRLLASSIRYCNQELAARIGVEVLGCVAFGPGLVPDCRGFALSVDLCDDLVEITGSVHVLPQRLAILGVVSTTVVLLGSIVNKWYTKTGQREDCCVSKLGVLATVVVQKSSIVVVVNEKSKCAQVFEVGSLGVVSGLNVAHVLTISEDVVNSVVHRIIKEASNIVLVGTNIGWVAIEALAHLENARCCTEF